jgi:hypothetical protein
VAQEPSSVAITGRDQHGKPFSSPASITLGFGLGQPLLINVTSASGNGAPTGTVTLMDGGAPIAQLPVNNQGQALFINCDPLSVHFCLTIGTHTITATYSGDSSLMPGSSQPLTISVVKSPPVLEVGFFCCFTSVTLEVVVDFFTGEAILGFPPTGTVRFFDSANNGPPTSLGSPVSLDQGPILLRFFDLVPGTHVVTVHYSGDQTYGPQNVSSGPISIAPSGLLPTRTTLQPLTPMVAGQPVKFKVTVTSPKSSDTPTGGVLVLAGTSDVNNQLGFNLRNGSAIVHGIMPNSSPTVQAFYFGDSKFDSSSSPPVNTFAAKTNAQFTIASNQTSMTAGSQVSVAATLTAPVGLDQPQGLVQFYDSLNGGKPTSIGLTQVLLTGGSATGAQTGTAAIAANLPAGVHTITAAYSGDTNYNAVPKSNSLTITVSKGP